MLMSRDTFLFHHTHTADSNRFEREVRGVHIDSHATDYIEIVRRLPAGQHAIFVKTDHWKTDSAYFNRLESNLEALGAELRHFDTHVYFDVDGSHAAIINGVEAAVNRQEYHITICGVPLDECKTYGTLDFEALREVAVEAGWIAPAHIGMPFHRYPPELIESICELARQPDIEVALGYTTGYFPLYNKLSRNEVPLRVPVRKHAERYEIPLLPELDLHAVIPEGFSGCGIVDTSAMDSLEDGELPVDALLSADLFRPGGCRNGVSSRQFFQNYSAFVPFIEGENHGRAFQQSLPETAWLRQVKIPANTVSLR